MATATPMTAPIRPPAAARAAKRDWLTLLFVVISFSLSMSVQQEYDPERTQLEYLMFIVPAIAIPLARPLSLIDAVNGKGWLLITFLAVAGAWHLLMGDNLATYQLALLIFVYTWHNSPDVRVLEADLTGLYVIMVLAGTAIWFMTDFNRWGLIPGTTVSEYGVWRVSFFPNIAFTAFLSLILVCVKTMHGWRHAARQPSFWIALYFLTFSFVRTAIVSLLIFMLLTAWYKRPRSKEFLFWTSLLMAIGVNVFIAYSAVMFSQIQDIPLVSRLFLRGEVGLSVYEIYQQLYRPWLWGEQLHQFWTSPYLMGWGSVEFQTLVTEALVATLEEGDTVSMPTRLLAEYGLPAILFIIYLIVCLWERAKARDAWACAMFPVVVLGLMQWGSLFHPSDAMGMIMMLAIVKGRLAFAPPPAPPRPARPVSHLPLYRVAAPAVSRGNQP